MASYHRSLCLATMYQRLSYRTNPQWPL